MALLTHLINRYLSIVTPLIETPQNRLNFHITAFLTRCDLMSYPHKLNQLDITGFVMCPQSGHKDAVTFLRCLHSRHDAFSLIFNYGHLK